MDTRALIFSDFGFGGRQVAGNYFILKTRAGMGAVAERLVLRSPAPAEANYRSAGETKSLPLGIVYFKITFDTNRTVVVNRDFCRWHPEPMLAWPRRSV